MRDSITINAKIVAYQSKKNMWDMTLTDFKNIIENDKPNIEVVMPLDRPLEPTIIIKPKK